jgi:hypothetical protein
MFGLNAAWRDIDNYVEWIRTIKLEKQNLNSDFNKYGLSHNYTYMLYMIITLTNEERQLPDEARKMKVYERSAPVNRYLDETLNFAEYIVPEFNQVFDEANEPTFDYVIAYRFAFKTLGMWWLLKRLGALGGLIYAGNKIDWPIVISWISDLM